jgi:hypothetical protein
VVRRSLHVSVALLSRGLWYSDSKEPLNSKSLLRAGIETISSNVLRDNPELYLTKEGLYTRLWRRLSPGYYGKTLRRFEPFFSNLLEDKKLSRRNEFRAEMLQQTSAQLERAPAIMPSNTSAPHGADERCDVCPSGQAVAQQEVSSKDPDSIGQREREFDSQPCSNTEPRHQTGHSEERKQEQDIDSLRIPRRTMIDLLVSKVSLSDLDKFEEAIRSGGPMPQLPGVSYVELLNQTSSRERANETHQAPEAKPDTSTINSNVRRHLKELFALAKVLAKQLETTVETSQTEVEQVPWLLHTMEQVVVPALGELQTLLTLRSKVKSSAKRPQ